MKSTQLFIRLSVGLVFAYAGAIFAQTPPPMPEMGGEFRLNYELYRMDKLISQGDATYSGDLNLTIPLLTVPGKNGHDFEIKLTYNSNISQRQTASWVGLGWDLEVGSIERTILGRLDEKPDGYAANQNLGTGRAKWRGYLDCSHEDVKLGACNKTDFAYDECEKDQPDLYTLHFDGGTEEIRPSKDTATGAVLFMTAPYRPVNIRPTWNCSGDQFKMMNFNLQNLDGASYTYKAIFTSASDANMAHLDGYSTDSPRQHFSYFYKWVLSDIAFPDGCTTKITYDHTKQPLQDYYGNVMVDRSRVDGDVNNYFGAGGDEWFPNGTEGTYPMGTVKYNYSYVKEIRTNTHHAVFLSVLPDSNVSTAFRGDRYERTNSFRKLKEIVLYENGTNKELKRIIFKYATSSNPNTSWQEGPTNPGTSRPWGNTERLNNDQLTLVSVNTAYGSDEDTSIQLPAYKFSYYNNPKVDWFYQTKAAPALDPKFPGYHTDTVFTTAWKIKEMILPTGGKIDYTYERYKVLYDPQGRNSTRELNGDTTRPWSYGMSPRARLKSKTITDTLGTASTWTFDYGDVMFDPPARPLFPSYIPSFYQENTLDEREFYKYFRGCPVGHRWVRVHNPDGSWIRHRYTSSFQDSTASEYDERERQPDDFDISFGTDIPYIETMMSHAGKRGLEWKLESGPDSTVTTYDFQDVESHKSRYEYHYITGGGNFSHYVREPMTWAKPTRTRAVHDGLTSTTDYYYHTSPHTSNENGLIRSMEEHGTNPTGLPGDDIVRTTDYTYAYEIYPPMTNKVMLSQLYSTSVTGVVLKGGKKNWTLWVNDSKYNHWVPSSEWSWNSSQITSTPPWAPDSTTAIRTSSFDKHDSCGRVTEVRDANGFVTRYYYGDNTNQFNQNGAYLTAVSKMRGHEHVPEFPADPPVWEGDSLTTRFKHDHYGNITEVKDENGNVTTGEYDRFGRLTKVVGPGNNVLNKYGYYYADSTISPTNPNAIFRTSFRTGSDSLKSNIYYDGFGYEIQRGVYNGSKDIITHSSYDNMYRPWKSYRTYEATLTTPHKFDALYALHDSAYYSSNSAGKSYSVQEYLTDGTGRLKHTHAPGEVFQNEADGHYLKFAYSRIQPEVSLLVSGVYSQGANWSVVPTGAGAVAVLNDTHLPDLPNDQTYLKFDKTGSYSPSSTDEFTVDLANPTAPPQGSGIVKMYFRWRGGGGAGSTLTTKVQLLEAGVVLAETTISYIQPKWESRTITAPWSSVTDFNSLQVKVSLSGSIPSAIRDSACISTIGVQLVPLAQEATYTTDENGHITTAYKNLFGQLTKTVVDSAGLNLVTSYENDVVGKLLKVTDPNGFVTTYSHNRFGSVSRKNTPDGGTTKYRCDLSANLRFQQDSVQSAGGKFTYQKFDSLNRITQIGEYTGDFASADSTTHGSASLDFPTSGPDSAKTINIYDKNSTADTTLSTARNLLGRLFSVQTVNNNVRDTCYYSYDSLGRVEWQIHRLAGLGAKKIAYEYDLQGNITKLSYVDPDNTSNNTYYFYDYDSVGRLAHVYSDESSSGVNKIKEAEYSYLANGKVKRFQAGTSQGMDYQYNERDWLTKINDTNLSPQSDSGHDGINGVTRSDKYAMAIGYNTLAQIADTNQNPQFNGNISWIAYNMYGVPYTGARGRTSLLGSTYKYDNANRLTSADFGYNRDSVWRTTTAYDEKNWSYDKIGNILSVERWGAGSDTVPNVVALTSRDSILTVSIGADSIRLGTSYVVPAGAIDNYVATTEIRLKPGYIAEEGSYVVAAISNPLVTTRMDSLTYNYSSGNSHLTSIADIVNANTYTTDLDNQLANNYNYDGNGNMISDLQNGIDSIIYDYRNLPLRMKRNGTWTTMRYDANGNRTFKSTPGGQTLHYILDASGKTIAVLDSDGTVRMLNVYGLGHIGYMSISYAITLDCSGGGGRLADSGDGGGGRDCRSITSRINSRYYYLKDHLGTIKMTVNSSGAVTSYDDYYPFGMFMEGRSDNFNQADARYKFSGKEQDVESGLVYFGVRFYDPRIGRWAAPDPLNGFYPNLSSYNYGVNNPIIVVDENGDSISVSGPMQGEFVSMFSHATSMLVGQNDNGNLIQLEGPVNTTSSSQHLRDFAQYLMGSNDKISINAIAQNDHIFFDGDARDMEALPGMSDVVDMGDYTAIGDEPELQAAMLSHVLGERSIPGDLNSAHFLAMIPEVLTLSEMTGKNLSTASRPYFDHGHREEGLARISGNTAYINFADYGQIGYWLRVPFIEPQYVNTGHVLGVRGVRK